MDTSLEWKIAVSQRTSTVDTARQEEKRNTATIMAFGTGWTAIYYYYYYPSNKIY